jgi:chromosome partitioning protein
MRRIALVNQKGGVGKTTTAVNLSAAISRLDRRVLLVDLDPQSNATVSLGVPPNDQKNTTYALLNGGPFQPLELTPTFHLVPSNIELAGAEMELTSVIGREIVLRDALADIKGYDFMILDCSPSLGLLSVNALTTAKEVMVPLQCEFLALHGISLLIRTVELVRKRLNPELSITGVIPCMYDVRKGLARDVVVEIEKHFGSKVFKSKIRSNVRLAEAPSHGKSIFDYAPDSYGAEDYLALAREIVGIERIQREPEAVAAEERVAVPLPTPELEIPAPIPELVAASGAPVAVEEPVVPPPPAPEPAPELTVPPPAPVLEQPAPPIVPEFSAPAALTPSTVVEPSPEPPTPDIVSDGVVEFIELIPLEIEDLPLIEPERTA